MSIASTTLSHEAVQQLLEAPNVQVTYVSVENTAGLYYVEFHIFDDKPSRLSHMEVSFEHGKAKWKPEADT